VFTCSLKWTVIGLNWTQLSWQSALIRWQYWSTTPSRLQEGSSCYSETSNLWGRQSPLKGCWSVFETFTGTHLFTPQCWSLGKPCYTLLPHLLHSLLTSSKPITAVQISFTIPLTDVLSVVNTAWAMPYETRIFCCTGAVTACGSRATLLHCLRIQLIPWVLWCRKDLWGEEHCIAGVANKAKADTCCSEGCGCAWGSLALMHLQPKCYRFTPPFWHSTNSCFVCPQASPSEDIFSDWTWFSVVKSK